MKKYEAYKDSGIEWIGEIPERWEIKKIKTLADTTVENSFVDGDWIESPFIEENGIRYITSGNIGNGVFKRLGNGFISEKTFANLKCKYAYSGDLVFSRLNAPYGRSCILPNDYDKYVIAVDNVILRTTQNKRFICYVTQCNRYEESVKMVARGTAMKRVSRTNLGDIVLPIPSVEEQQAIASYLDYKVGQIDASISAINSQINDLKAYRQSIISEAVTKGLNPDVKMKDSGVEWIGEIPEMWKCTKLGWLYPNMGSGTTPDTNNLNYYSENGYNWLQTGDLNDGVITETSKHITDLAVNERGMKIYPSGSVVVAMYGATIGKVGLLSIDTTTNQACCVLPIMENIYNRYTFYVMLSSKMSLISKSVGGGQPNISQTIIKEHKIPVPPLHEQQAIASYLDSKTIKIDSVIKSLEAQRNDLNALKQSIISEAVTGKIDLREW